MTAPTDTVGWHPLILEAYETDSNEDFSVEEEHLPSRIDKEAPGVKPKPRCIRRGHAGHRF